MLRGLFPRNCTAASYGLASGFDRWLGFLSIRAFGADGQVARAHLGVDLGGNVGMVAQELLRVLAALSDPRLAVIDPRAGFVENAHRDAHVDEPALARDALAREDLDLGDAEGRSDLVLHDLHLDATADDHVALFDRLDRSDVDAHGRVELQRPATRSCFGVPEHHPYLLAQLVDEDDRGVRLGDSAGELAERLTHEPGLQSHEGVAHLALDLFAGHERRDRVDDDDVHGTRAHERVRDLERLLTVVGLRDEKVVRADAAGARSE